MAAVLYNRNGDDKAGRKIVAGIVIAANPLNEQQTCRFNFCKFGQIVFMSSQAIQETKKENAATPSKPMTKAEMFQKILADQKIIREALQNGVSLKELEKTHGFKFARLRNITGE